MISIGLRMESRFLAAEGAPSPAEVSEGASIPNHLGIVVMHPRITDTGHIEIDLNSVPPTIKFRELPATLIYGNTNHEGEFYEFNNALSRRSAIVDGSYTGPNSELVIY